MIFHPTVFELEGGIVERDAPLHHRSATGTMPGYTPLCLESERTSSVHRLHAAAVHVISRTADFMAAVGEVHLRRHGMSIVLVDQMDAPRNPNMQEYYE